MSIAEIKRKLKAMASTEIATSSQRYFKTGKGQYGEGDKFIGVRVPEIRKLSLDYNQTELAEVEALLQSSIHEERLLALLILVQRVKSKCSDVDRKQVHDLYFRNVKYVNNWDLVDSSAPTIVGGYAIEKLEPNVRQNYLKAK